MPTDIVPIKDVLSRKAEGADSGQAKAMDIVLAAAQDSMVTTVDPQGRKATAINMSLGAIASTPNNILQFSFDNTAAKVGEVGTDAVQEILRIGGILSQAGIPAIYGATPGGADSRTLKINGEVGAKAIEALSLIVCSRPLLISEIRIVSDDVTCQTAGLKVTQVGLDGVIHQSVVPQSVNQNTYDTRNNLIIIRPKNSIGWILDVQTTLDFIIPAGAGKTGLIILEVASVASNSAFSKY